MYEMRIIYFPWVLIEEDEIDINVNSVENEILVVD